MKLFNAHCSSCLLPRLQLRWLLLVMLSVMAFAGVELWVGLMSHSLTLRADSGHMLTDGLAIGIALTAAWGAQRSHSAPTGNHRWELLAALINGLALLAMAAWIGREALTHWQGEPAEILSWPMLITALLGLLVNSLNLYWLHGDVHENLNVRGVFLHVLADLMGSVGAILAALAVTFLQWTWADTLIGTVVAVIIAMSALPLLWQSWRRMGDQQSSHSLQALEVLEAAGWREVGHSNLSELVRKQGY